MKTHKPGMKGAGVQVLRADSDYQLGKIAGEKNPCLYRRLIRMGLRLRGRWTRLSRPAHADPSARGRMLKRLYPRRLERIKGLSLALGLEESEVIAASDFLGTAVTPRCTTFAALPPATGDGGIYLSWNVDIAFPLRFILGRMPLFVLDLPDCHPYVAWGMPALFGMGLLNARGVATVINGVGMSDGGEGLNAGELNNLAMETCETVEQVADVFRDNPREVFAGHSLAVLMNANSIWTDLEGNAVTIEYSHDHIVVQEADGRKVMAEANHHQYLDQGLSGGANPGTQASISGSYARLGRMWELLDEHHGEIDAAVARAIAGDHGTNYRLLEPWGISREWYQDPIDDGTICAHYWNAADYLKRGRFKDAFVIYATSCTIYSILIAPRSFTMYLCYGWPCRNPHVPLYVGGHLGAEPREEPEPGAIVPGLRVAHRKGKGFPFDIPPTPEQQELKRKIHRAALKIDKFIDAD